MPRLILNADDFGLTPGINRAIVELHRAGVITSTSLMATGPAFDEAVELAQQNPTLGIGCHLVFCDGIPISHPDDIPTLLGADGKTFRPESLDFAQAAMRSTIHPGDLAREAQAQIQKLQRAGIDVTHIDTHKHTHMMPSIARPVLHIAERCGVLPLRKPFEPRWSSSLTRPAALRRLQLRLAERFLPAFDKFTEQRKAHGLLPDGTLGIAATGILDAPTLRATMAAVMCQPAGTTWELCCHPGHVDEALEAQTTWLRASREIEYEALLEVIPEMMRTAETPELIHYGNLGVAGLQRASGQFTPFNGFEKVL